MIKIVICDDEAHYLEKIEKLIRKYLPSDFEVDISTFTSGEELLENLNFDSKLDIVFMDIEMNKINGIDAVRELKQKKSDTIIFFITSHDGYITDIFRLGTFQFLVKPINEEDFKLDFLRAIQHYTHNHTKLELKQKDRIICIENIEILYIAVHHKKITVYTRKGNYEFVGKIAEYENKLKAYSFVNCHKSIIVNLEHIEEIKFDSVKLLDCDSYIPISRNYHESFLKKFNQFSEGKYL